MNKFVLLIFFLALFISNPSKAQKWQKLKAEAEALGQNGNYEEALNTAIKASSAAEKEYGKEQPEYATSLQDIGIYLGLLGNYEDAYNYIQKAQQLRITNPGRYSPDYA